MIEAIIEELEKQAAMEEALREVAAAADNSGWVVPDADVVAFEDARLSSGPCYSPKAVQSSVVAIDRARGVVMLENGEEFGLLTQSAAYVSQDGRTVRVRRLVPLGSEKGQAMMLTQRQLDAMDVTERAFQQYLATPKMHLAQAAKDAVTELLGLFK